MPGKHLYIITFSHYTVLDICFPLSTALGGTSELEVNARGKL